MTEPDELYTLRAQYWLGHYTLALDEGKQAARRPMPPHLKSEREELVLRCHLALGQYDKVMSEGNSGGKSPALKALALHASYLSGASETRDAVVDEMKVLLADPSSASNTSLQLFACHVFLAHGLLKEALQCVHHGLTMEHLAACVQIYLRIDRIDLANDALNLLKQADEDSVLAQLCGAYVAVATGRSASDDAVHVLGGLSEQYGPSLMLLNVMAAANMVGGRYDAAEGNLKEAIAEFGGENDADTLVNLVTCSQHLGRRGGEVERYLSALKMGCKDHPFVRGLVQVEGAFEREATKYMTA
mmetsp:Transcript_37628/g.80313  ORF Transcript_37628/g.80313 Transcript_37628/m.80313 type:complete len:302 (-) Transcript_37628:131-1036(-)|eukprot:CAMPEP_0172554324 /NCGR_PEP_ID=MMETSP1067-20121228/54023_1 /TAXON_ID=265564 ORGANISM="Thalassiosira punctigera, Strain Tpunct2005C2" /NCGR_SAMPLE_ID=MMETSP1067 /ASSEMBLY_ACC=CAM_ASM_000444 /LENGTH=301 /DNA_ID=CAMNT_0013342667 /DNA_START=45 /DNA_END=950 /DNA_ORIENTATION=+